MYFGRGWRVSVVLGLDQSFSALPQSAFLPTKTIHGQGCEHRSITTELVDLLLILDGESENAKWEKYQWTSVFRLISSGL